MEKSLSSFSCSLNVKSVKILLILNGPGDIGDDLLEVALLRHVHFLLMLDLKVEEEPMIDLTLIPCPLIVVEMLNGGRVEEWIVISGNNTGYQTSEKTNA